MGIIVLALMKYQAISAVLSGLYIRGDIRGTSFISLGKENIKAVLVAPNNGEIQLLRINQE
jgi:hypothetical protein